MSQANEPRGAAVGAPRALILLARLGLRKALRGRLVWGCMALLALPLAVLIPLQVTGNSLTGEDLKTFFRVWLTTLLPLSAVLMAYSGVSEEVESQTITYIHSRPLPRWALPAGKLLTAWLLVAPVACVLVGGGAVFTQVTPLDGGFVAGLLLASATYCALATTAGAIVPKHAVLASLGLFALLDMGFANVPGFTQTLAPSFHVENLTALSPPPGGLSRIITSPTTSASSSMVALVAFTTLFSLVAVLRTSYWEHRRLS